MVKIRFQISDIGVNETLWAVEIEPGRYRLDNSPFYAYGVSWQDVVEATFGSDDVLEFVRVVSKSGNRTLRLIFEDYAASDDRAKSILASVRQLGCSYEGMHGKLISVNVPPEADLDSVTAFLTGIPSLQWEHADPTYEELSRTKN